MTEKLGYKIQYIILDPVGNRCSGISVYSEMIYSFIFKNFGIECVLKQKKNSETIELFYEQVYEEIENEITNDPKLKIIVELPDTYCYLAKKLSLLRKKITIHIRLHGMDAIIRTFQKSPYDEIRFIDELSFIAKADVISAPSKSVFEETKKYIDIDDCIIYPNPIPEYKESSEKTIEQLFVGKFTNIKGSALINKLSKKVKIFVYSPLKPKNEKVVWIDSSKVDKNDIYLKAKCVLMPSLYESFSLVLYEALSCGCKVVCSERIPKPATQQVIDKDIIFAKLKVSEFLKAIDKINKSKFSLNYKLLYEEFNRNIYYCLEQVISFQGNNILSRQIKLQNRTSSAKMNKCYKKFLKLAREPRKFFYDSKFFKFIFENIVSVLNKNTRGRVVDERIESDGCKLISIKISRPMLSDELNIKYQNLCQTSLSKDNLLIVDDDSECIKSIISNINWFDEARVVQFKSKNLAILKYQNDKFTSSTEEILNAFPSEVKEFFGKFKFVLSCNPLSNYINAIRLCSTKVRTICIITNEKSIEYISPLNTDCLIISKHLVEKIKDVIDQFRFIDIIDITNMHDIEFSVKESLRQLSSKDFNMFIPIKFDELSINNFVDPDLYISYDILCNFECATDSNNITFEQLLNSITVKSLLVREELYFRYKNLITYSKNKDDYRKLLGVMLKDGNKIYEGY